MRGIIKKQITILLVAVMFLTAIPLNAFADDGDVAEDVSTPVNCVTEVDGKLCYYNENGVVDTFSGWKTIGEDTYWADEEGTILPRGCLSITVITTMASETEG